jgi:hypothetical protein
LALSLIERTEGGRNARGNGTTSKETVLQNKDSS